MHLKEIGIKNLKGLKEAVFNPSSFTCLVGENNAGKSTVLQAIATALKPPSQLSANFFYDAALPVELALEFDSVTSADLLRLAEEHRHKIEDLVINGALSLQLRYRFGEKLEITTRRLVPTEERFRSENIAAALAGKRGDAVRQAVIGSYSEFAANAPAEMNITQAKAYLAEQIAALPNDQFAPTEAPLPSGISSSITTLIPEPIYIPAVKNFADDLKTTQTTSFGRLLGLLLEDMTPDLVEISQTLEQLNGLFNRVLVDGGVADRRHDKVKSLEAMVENFLSENFPRAKVELVIPRPELKTILNAAQIFVDDGSKDLIDNKGDGIKRSLTFALLQTYVSHLRSTVEAGESNGSAPRPLIFLFEEPELYLHPKSQRVLFGTLARISETHQVVVTTHSPIFFAPGVTAAFVRVAKVAALPKPVGVLYPVNFDLDQVSAEVFRMARFENADAAFFSRRVVLFEGESDDAYCRHIAKTLNPDWDFDHKNIALVRVSGKGNFAKFRRFFEAFGIEVKIVADLDALFDGYQHLGAAAAVTPIRTTTIAGIDARAVALGTKAEPAARQIKDKLNQDNWRVRWAAAKRAVSGMQESQVFDPAAIQLIDNLFVWEQDIARVKVCREDVAAQAALIPTLDEMRASGICVLSRGAIEDYYPVGTPPSGSKPERALAACKLVQDALVASTVSTPLAAGRQSELHDIFSELFRDA